jgi:hypothetical protein
MAKTSLHALTIAALALPGVLTSPAVKAEDNEASLQYGYYQEGERNTFGLANNLKPIHVDTLGSTGSLRLTDRIKLGFNYIQDTWAGATPITTAPRGLMIDGLSGASSHVNSGTNVLVDKNFNPLQLDFKEVIDPVTGNASYPTVYTSSAQDKQPVHMLTSASPETRKQGNFSLGYEWDEAALTVGGGTSVERDYNSSFVSSNGRWDLNHKLTRLNAGMSYTNSDINAQRMDSASRYIDYSRQSKLGDTFESPITGNRQDWTANIGLSQVLNKSALVETGLSYSHNEGYLSNPYKATTFIFKDPNQSHTIYPDNVFVAELTDALENRPNQRNQLTWDLRYVQHIAPVDAALHLDYRFFNDDWGIMAHTFSASWDQPLANGWSITPNIRYYSQSAADFYQPYFTFNQQKPVASSGGIAYDQLPITHYSSDQRLSGYGVLSGGITVSKKFTKGIHLDAGFTYFNHAGGLKLGGGGEGSYADFDYYMVNAALTVNLAALSLGNQSNDDHAGHHQHHHSGHAPAGVMFDHMLPNAGDVMLGYRYMYGRQAGDMLHETSPVSDQAIASSACAGVECTLAPTYMNMHMHMLDLMYAPTDWLTLMLMPQFVDMNMSMQSLAGISPTEVHNHATGGIGDTSAYALFKLFNNPNHHVHTAIGISAPTGNAAVQLTPGGHHGGVGGFIHYGMQLGSGTWDFKPSLTYTGQQDRWSWGAQLNGTVRMQDSNSSGYALGDVFQTSAWGSYSLLNWLSASLRGVYTVQGGIKNGFNGVHPTEATVDFANNYGGRYWDVGFGLSAVVPSGDLQGNRLSFEWLQPVSDDVNGYQLQREGALSATWSYAF